MATLCGAIIARVNVPSADPPGQDRRSDSRPASPARRWPRSARYNARTPGEGRAAGAGADREGQREHAERGDPQHPADDHQQGVGDRLEQADQRRRRLAGDARRRRARTATRRRPAAGRRRSTRRRPRCRARCRGRNRRFRASAPRPPADRARPSPACSASAPRPAAAGTALVSSWIISVPKIADAVQMMTIHSTDRPAIRPARAASAPLRDADDQQRDDQRNDGHLERVEPQPADHARHLQRRLAQAVAEHRRAGAQRQPERPERRSTQ